MQWSIELIEQLQQISKLNNLKPAPEESIHMLLKVQFLGHEIANRTNKPVHFKVEAIHKLKKPTKKRELMRFIRSTTIYSKFIFLLVSIFPTNLFTLFYMIMFHFYGLLI